MTPYIYGAALLVSLAGLVTIDRRWSLALFENARRTVVTVVTTVAVFFIFDVMGVALGIFFVGDGPYLSGLRIAPEVPIEELLFLTLLAYQTLLLWRAFARQGRRGMET